MTVVVLFPPSLGARARSRAEVVRDELARALGQEVVVEVARDYEQLKARTSDDDVDLVWAPPALLRQIRDASRAILRVVRDGGRTSYRAALMVRRGLSLSSLDELAGRRAAWVDAGSSAGYLLPREHLRRHGLDPSQLFASECFHGSYRSALLSVAHGNDDVCSIYCSRPEREAVDDSLETEVGGLKDRLDLVAFTEETDNDGLVVTRQADAATAEALVTLFTAETCPPTLLQTWGAETFAAEAP